MTTELSVVAFNIKVFIVWILELALEQEVIRFRIVCLLFEEYLKIVSRFRGRDDAELRIIRG